MLASLKASLITSICALLIGAASAGPGLTLKTKVVNLRFESSKARMSAVNFPPACADRAHSDPDTPAGYQPLGTANINGRCFAVYAFQNGSKPDDVASQGKGFADVFDSTGHLMRRFSFIEKLNSPAQVTEYVPMSAR